MSNKSLATDRETLVSALAAVKPIVPRRASIPILSNILLRATDDGAAQLVASDLDHFITVALDGAAPAEGFAACLPHANLADMAKKAAKGTQIRIEATGAEEFAGVTVGAVTAQLQARAIKDFPELKFEGKVAGEFELKSGTLADALRRVQFCISSEETRYYLNGVLFEAHKDELRLVATDGHRLGYVPLVVHGLKKDAFRVIVPAATIALLFKQCSGRGAPDSIRAKINTNKALFTAGKVSILAKLIDGTFPDYQRVLPRDFEVSAMVYRDHLAGAVMQLQSVSDVKARAVALKFSSGKLTLIVDDAETGTASTSIECDYEAGARGGEFTVGFNSSYLLDCLAAEDSETVSLRFRGDGPARIAVSDHASAFYVLMPMRVSGEAPKSREERNAEAAEQKRKHEAAAKERQEQEAARQEALNVSRELHSFGPEAAEFQKRAAAAIDWSLRPLRPAGALQFALAVCEMERARWQASREPEDARLAPLAAFLAGQNPLARGELCRRQFGDVSALAPIYDARALAAWSLAIEDKDRAIIDELKTACGCSDDAPPVTADVIDVMEDLHLIEQAARTGKIEKRREQFARRIVCATPNTRAGWAMASDLVSEIAMAAVR